MIVNLKRLTQLMLIACSGLLISCIGRNAEQNPVSVTWDRDIGVQSGMAISDPRFAAQVVASSGEAFKFVDIGAAVQWLNQHEEIQKPKIWTKVLDKDTWYEVNVVFWKEDVVGTPMGHGFAAYSKPVEGAINYNGVVSRIHNGETRLERNKLKQRDK